MQGQGEGRYYRVQLMLHVQAFITFSIAAKRIISHQGSLLVIGEWQKKNRNTTTFTTPCNLFQRFPY